MNGKRLFAADKYTIRLVKTFNYLWNRSRSQVRLPIETCLSCNYSLNPPSKLFFYTMKMRMNRHRRYSAWKKPSFIFWNFSFFATHSNFVNEKIYWNKLKILNKARKGKACWIVSLFDIKMCNCVSLIISEISMVEFASPRVSENIAEGSDSRPRMD